MKQLSISISILLCLPHPSLSSLLSIFRDIWNLFSSFLVLVGGGGSGS
jgi:hypothetical protein